MFILFIMDTSSGKSASGGSMDVDPAPQPAPPAGSLAVAEHTANYFTSQSASNADSSAATASANQTHEGPQPRLGMTDMKDVIDEAEESLPEPPEETEGSQRVNRRNRGQGRGGRGQHQGRGQFQGQGNRGGTIYPTVGDYKPENVQRAKAQLEALKKRKRERLVSGEMPVAKVAKIPSAQPAGEDTDRRDSAAPAPLDYNQIIMRTRLIRAALKVGNLEIIGNAFKTTKNYSVKVAFDSGRNGQASISLRFRIKKGSHVEEREVSLNDSDVWNFYLQFKFSTSGRQPTAIQQFGYSFIDKANPKSETEEALIKECALVKECGEREQNRLTSINLEVVRVYIERGERTSIDARISKQHHESKSPAKLTSAIDGVTSSFEAANLVPLEGARDN